MMEKSVAYLRQKSEQISGTDFDLGHEIST